MSKILRLSEASPMYLNHLRARGLAPSTVKGRDQTLRRLRSTVGDLSLQHITADHIDRMFAAHDWNPGTHNQRLAQLTSFFNWARARGYITTSHNPLHGWRTVKIPKVDRLRIPRDEWERLFAVTRDTRERAILAIGLYQFLRESELRTIRIRDVHLSDGTVDVYRTKTRDRDTMPVSSELDTYVREHLTFLSQSVKLEPDHYFICGFTRSMNRDERGRITANTEILDPTRPYTHPARLVKTILGRAGYPTHRQGVHTLRRSGARAYFDELVSLGYDGALRRVQSMLGHSASTMTEVYLGLDLDRRQRNEDLRHKPMFQSSVRSAKIVPIRGEMNG